MTEIKLQLPEDNCNPIGFFFEKVKKPEEVYDLILTKEVFERMKDNQNVEQIAMFWFSYEYPTSMWDVYENCSKISYTIEHVSKTILRVRIISNGKKEYSFPNLEGNKRVIILSTSSIKKA